MREAIASREPSFLRFVRVALLVAFALLASLM